MDIIGYLYLISVDRYIIYLYTHILIYLDRKIYLDMVDNLEYDHSIPCPCHDPCHCFSRDPGCSECGMRTISMGYRVCMYIQIRHG